MHVLSAIPTFIRVAECGSFSAVAREFGTTQPNISKQIAALEAHLGVRLFSRTTRQVRLTEEGLSYFRFATKIQEAITEADASVGKAKKTPTGLVRISSPFTFAKRHLIQKVATLLKLYPQLRIEIISSDLSDNLVEYGIDVAIRFGNQSGDVVARRVGTASRVAVASTSYLNAAGEPRTAHELAAHNCLVFANPIAGNIWTFTHAKGSDSVAISGSFSSNNAEILREACLSGLGIALMPEWLFFEDLQSKKVKSILHQYEPEGMPIFVTYASRKFIPPKLRVVLDYLIEELSHEPALAPHRHA